MATNSDIRDQAYQFFLEEAPELLQTIETGLLVLGQRRDTAEVHQIMRAAHSLKGGAASVGLDPIKVIAHRLETLFKALYSDQLIIDSDLESQLLKAFDCLRFPLTQQLTEGRFDGDQALAQAEPVLQALEAQLANAIAATENFIPSSSELGVDMATSIFDIDVQQGLTHLEQVLTSPSQYSVAGELRAQAEIFLGFAELLDLDGFAQIAQTALQALEVNPNQALDITRLALEDFRQGREAVLTQGSTSGGSPSAGLQALALAAETVEVEDDGDTELTATWGEPVELPEEGGDRGDQPSITEVLESGWQADLPSEADALRWLTQATPAEAITADEPIPDPAREDTGDGQIPEGDRAPTLGTDPMPSLDTFFAGLSPTQEDWLEAGADWPTQSQNVPESEDGVPEIIPEPAPETVPSVDISLAAAAVPLPTGLTVRVDTQRLARLDNQLGELTINRNGLALQASQIRLGLKELTSRFERVRTTVEQLQAVSDQILIAPERQRQPVAIGSLPTPTEPTAGFDSLEMDTYTALYRYTQTLIEDMVQLEEAAADIALFNRQSDLLLGQHRKMLSQVQDDLMYARMVPLGQVLNRLPRVLRDLSNTYGKPADLTLEGTDLLVDKAVLEKLYDPLLHLLRNGFDHGLEPAEERTQQGKPAVGQITIRAYYRGRQVVIEVSDDGRGLDMQRVRQRLIALEWLSPTEAEAASPKALSHYLFQPGFSTADQVSDLSGRGVGLDVVQAQLRQLKGTVTVQSVPGQGTRFTLALPMTLSIVNLLICFVGSTPIAFRSDSINEILVPRAEQLETQLGQEHLRWQGQSVPLYRLSDLLAYRCLLPERPLSQVLAAVPSPSDWEAPALILERNGQVFAIQVDRLVTEQESVIKPFGTALTPPSYAYGCTILGDGSLVPVIDGYAFLDYLLSQAADTSLGATLGDAVAATTPPPSRPTLYQTTTLLVVDDAVTSRRTLALSLERAGYRVLQAHDGQEALEQLAQNPAVRLVVCDIEMPNMNGFEFLTARRQDPALAHIPTLMLTSRSNDKHRWLAMQLGATDYFSKPYLEQEFLAAIATHLQAATPS
ncbi:hybrid sensor histidine kinase/response regulator [Nodosilinea sp. P-1105]|uniref:hybrid sensor histidine kinase/response regulator n=1 Tax=Nodosilinea sp. P-1105 TaxID=2546229 RepID=UPI001469BBA8|nr:hybrid sensor histidine kinase/response regulator [Nodosilinea sp. P-1105]NMF84764.1 hybrid sensor histidine kinase/response regulator [Nodosilinea sp. P-1105]